MSSPNAIERRRAIARRAAEQYAANPAVAAVLLAGSVARGLADDFSDIELDIYWRRAPTEVERVAAAAGAGWEPIRAEKDEHEWADSYRIDGVKLDASSFLTSTIDGYLSAVLLHADTEPELQVRVTTSLALAMVAKGLALRPRERLEMLVARDDVLVLHRDLVDNLQGLLDALFGLNRMFTPHPFHKWLEWEATLIPLKPPDLVRRIRGLLCASPREAVDQVSALAEETFDLVAAHLPEFQIAPVREAFAFRRTT
jgi:predicted nucleotidyltransferase